MRVGYWPGPSGMRRAGHAVTGPLSDQPTRLFTTHPETVDRAASPAAGQLKEVSSSEGVLDAESMDRLLRRRITQRERTISPKNNFLWKAIVSGIGRPTIMVWSWQSKIPSTGVVVDCRKWLNDRQADSEDSPLPPLS